jgi:DNA-directed RNA polymerase subunit RPC12/RpoP
MLAGVMGRKRTGKTDRMMNNPLDFVEEALAAAGGERDGGKGGSEGKAIACFLCGRRVEIRLSKKGRPYFICDDCGLQVFIRGDTGIRRLKELASKNEE